MNWGIRIKAASSRESGDAYAAARERMVREQLAAPDRGIANAQVLHAMATVPRHEFVPGALRDEAYEDHPLPVGNGQTISQPFIVAFMTEQLHPKPTDRILEIGTGTGYQAAVLSKLVKEVYTIEIVPELARQAAENFRRLGCGNLFARAGDGYAGWPEQAPFDAIIVACAPDHIPEPLSEQLAEGGRLVIPTGGSDAQELVLLEKRAGSVKQRALLAVRFVPMTRPPGP